MAHLKKKDESCKQGRFNGVVSNSNQLTYFR